ncbi:DUF2520 domain-containing protein [Chitinimonas sp.]|uniref:Rossmann-like and DUF2520 domain-containing protein n=1 Tax=Chitinimonas sp. TaxID=1934313 RepID=UPI002F9268B8
MPLPTLNLIGPGRLGLTLASLWQRHGVLQIGGLRARQTSTVAAAQATLGTGLDCSDSPLPPCDYTLIATPDDAIPAAVAMLMKEPGLAVDSVVFHASGALSSEVLAPLRSRGIHVASIHPLRSFAAGAMPATLAGTWCGCEGDAQALARLGPLFDALGAHRFQLESAHKTLYHAGAVLACNDLIALMETALRCMAAAGVPREQAWPALRPLIDGTLANLDRLTPAAALTGPIARGDRQTVLRQLTATAELDPAVAAVYRSLGQVALQLARLSAEQEQALGALLEARP